MTQLGDRIGGSGTDEDLAAGGKVEVGGVARHISSRGSDEDDVIGSPEVCMPHSPGGVGNHGGPVGMADGSEMRIASQLEGMDVMGQQGGTFMGKGGQLGRWLVQ